MAHRFVLSYIYIQASQPHTYISRPCVLFANTTFILRENCRRFTTAESGFDLNYHGILNMPFGTHLKLGNTVPIPSWKYMQIKLTVQRFELLDN